MKDKIELLECSFRTNIHMARTQCYKLHFESARQYLESAKSDKKKLKDLKSEWNNDNTKEYVTIK